MNNLNCNHIFEGRADGVHCKKCNLYLTPEEYAEFLKPKKEPNSAKRKAKKVVENPEVTDE